MTKVTCSHYVTEVQFGKVTLWCFDALSPSPYDDLNAGRPAGPFLR